MFFVIDENNNKIEAFDKEGVLAALNKAIADGSLNDLVADSAFISKIKCCVNGITNNVAFVTTAKYNELEASGTLQENTAYFITDDTTLDGLNAIISGILDGTTVVPKALSATSANSANSATSASQAGKVVNAIGDVAIQQIFEEDGKTVKNATNADYATKIKCTRKAITIDTPANTIFEDFQLANYRRYAIEFSYKDSNGLSFNCLATGIAYEGVLVATVKHYFPSIMEMRTFDLVFKNVDLTYNSQFIEGRVNGTSYSNAFDISAIYVLEKVEE